MPEMAVRAAHALSVGEVASEKAATSTNGQIGCSGRLCLPVILQLHPYLLPSHLSPPTGESLLTLLHHLQTVIAMRKRETIMGLASQLILFAFQADRAFALVLGLSGSTLSLFSLAL